MESQARQLHKEAHDAEAKGGRARVGWGWGGREAMKSAGVRGLGSSSAPVMKTLTAAPQYQSTCSLNGGGGHPMLTCVNCDQREERDRQVKTFPTIRKRFLLGGQVLYFFTKVHFHYCIRYRLCFVHLEFGTCNLLS